VRQVIADQPDGVMQVHDLDRRALAVVGVDEARAEADDVAVDAGALLLEIDVDQVLARLDAHRPELVVQDLGARRRPRVADRDVHLCRTECRRAGVGSNLAGQLGVGAGREQRAERQRRQGDHRKRAA
jgi:hypothetical protein